MIPVHVMRTTAEFDCPVKAAAVHEFMETNGASFQQTTDLLGLQHGVDFLLTTEDMGPFCG